MRNIAALGLFLLGNTFTLEANETPVKDCHALACEYLEWYENTMDNTNYNPEDIYNYAYDDCIGNQQ